MAEEKRKAELSTLTRNINGKKYRLMGEHFSKGMANSLTEIARLKGAKVRVIKNRRDIYEIWIAE